MKAVKISHEPGDKILGAEEILMMAKIMTRLIEAGEKTNREFIETVRKHYVKSSNIFQEYSKYKNADEALIRYNEFEKEVRCMNGKD